MAKKKSKRGKKYTPKKQKPAKELPAAPTANAKIIRDLMAVKKVKGRYKDHVIITGNRMIDWLGSYDILRETEDGVKQFGVEGMVLVHKSKLVKFVGEELAHKFWRNGRRTNYNVESRRRGCAARQG